MKVRTSRYLSDSLSSTSVTDAVLGLRLDFVGDAVNLFQLVITLFMHELLQVEPDETTDYDQHFLFENQI